MREILHYSGFKVIGKVVYPGTKGQKVIPERLLRKSERLGRKLSKLQ